MLRPLPGAAATVALGSEPDSDLGVCPRMQSFWSGWRRSSLFPGLTCGRPAVAMSEIDVAGIYTPEARRKAGGTAEIEAAIGLMIAETNQIYVESGVNQRVVLVARKAVEYAESGSTSEDLGRLASSSDGYMDETHAIRDRAGPCSFDRRWGGLRQIANAFGPTCAECG